MISLFDYLKWRGDISFNCSPLNEIDSLIFSQLCYIPYDNVVSSSFEDEGISIKQFYDEHIGTKKESLKMGALIPNEKIVLLLKYAANSPRFQNVRVRGYINDIDKKHEKQFCAMCFDLPDETTYVCFSGTDDTIIGWKENFNMALFTPVPSQNEGVQYLNRLSVSKTKKLYVGGHSKGGNIAIYASFMCGEKIQEKIEAIYNFDGPGFRYDFLRKARKNPKLIEKVTNFMPDSAIIGAIFDTIGKRIYVKSKGNGFQQHDLFTWYLSPPTGFSTVTALAKSSIQFHNSLERWVANMTDKEKVEFIDAFYKLCSSNDSNTITDILSNKRKFIMALFKVDEKSKSVLWKVMAGSVKGYFVSSDIKPVTIKNGKKIQLLKTKKK